MEGFAKIQSILAATCPHDIEEITLDKHLVTDLDIDSFGLMDLVMTFEAEFGIEIPDRDLRLFNTVEDIVNYLEHNANGFAMAEA